ncbi:MAG: hypothetical protein AAFZ49_11290, partial [Cyanobacteria bacterium J06659_2]
MDAAIRPKTIKAAIWGSLSFQHLLSRGFGYSHEEKFIESNNRSHELKCRFSPQEFRFINVIPILY